MRRNSEEELQRVHVHLFQSDVEKVHALFDSNIGFSKAVRTMLRKFLRSIEEKAGARRIQADISDIIGEDEDGK